jgi:hemerythrin-like domain-containing protein
MSTETLALQQLEREHRTAERLVNRLAELGERLRGGEWVAPGTVRLGVGLLESYLHRVHANQFDRELWPRVETLVGPGCQSAIARVRDGHEAMRASARLLLDATARWSGGDGSAQEEVARRLTELAAADRVANEFEENHPFVCLRSHLPLAVRADIGRRFDEHSGTKSALQGHIERFLTLSSPARE